MGDERFEEAAGFVISGGVLLRFRGNTTRGYAAAQGSWLAARIVVYRCKRYGLKPIDSIEVGVLMSTKELVELVLLGVGLQVGVLSESSYGIN